jgi:hypothetical protein
MHKKYLGFFSLLLLSHDNNQLWKQTDSAYLRLNLNDTIYIERGILNSFFMGMDESNRRIRVKRIK